MRHRTLRSRIGSHGRVCLATMVGLLAALAIPSLALAHLERPSYWPDPAPDTSITPAAGGEVPKQRSLVSAVNGNEKGEVNVVCQGRKGAGKSMFLLKKSLRKSIKPGFRVRPSEPRVQLSKKKAKQFLRINKKLKKQCSFRHIQDAIDASGNNDRVVIMPGRYTEPESRKAPENDPRCAELTQLDTEGRETPSYRYQVTCPHDQNLVYVQGRETAGEPPSPPLNDRHGIPDLGPCLKCNLQVEGSGPRPVDVVVDAANRGKKRAPGAKPGAPQKDVVFRADRADGFAIVNMTLKGAGEHGFYTEETDGYLLNKVKMLWNLHYGNLSYTADHGLFKNCDAMGSGDAGLYPGASPETGEQADESFYPDAPRINTVVKRCDMRGNVFGYSGSMGNAIRLTENDIYGNSVGISADTFSASGHPGFPADSMVIDNNNIYSNNLNPYAGDHGVTPLVPSASGSGIWFPGMNNATITENYIFDNWRYGTMLFAIPDVLVTPENEIEPGMSCQTGTPEEEPEDNKGQSTSCGNRFFANHMGQSPPGWEPPAGFQTPNVARAPVATHGGEGSGLKRLPNGLDFWWDEMSTNTGNCWFDNEGADGTPDGITADPAPGEVDGVNEPGTLPDDCETSVGSPVAYPVKLSLIVECATWDDGDQAEDFQLCDWFETPPEPGKDDEFEPQSAAASSSTDAASSAKLLRRMSRALEQVDVGAWAGPRPRP